MKKIIQKDKGIIPACDVNRETYHKIIKETFDLDGVSAYKIGFQLALMYGLSSIVSIAKDRYGTNKPLIYDHQKAGTDIPDTGEKFMKILRRSSIDAVILFPQSGPATEEAWIKAAQDNNLGVIIGGLMTHPKYLRSEHGYIADEAVMEMYVNAARLGVSDFVVPGNKPESIKKIKQVLEEEGINPVFYAPGFVAQGGQISETAKVAGDSWHAIVGRGIYEAENIRQAALDLTSKL